ncbi:hypothetical protein BDN72DRAFT_797234 [Pluteus cervinus]|uniref:Uncharacterized protein n=1 Tax=Pluteus cervinus TaxID=181527 RepID=A0ACD3ATE5_9AGAR|nr:hypothetical protein BDN72DRAFT_797234 [Pluteus cervinus]
MAEPNGTAVQPAVDVAIEEVVPEEAPAQVTTTQNGSPLEAAEGADDHHDAPPPMVPANVVELVSLKDGKIIHVNLYVGRAEIERSFKFPVRTGQNQVNICGLPNVLDKDSLRVEGRGAATIHDVTLSEIPLDPVATTSPELEALYKRKARTQAAFERCNKASASLETFIDSLHVQHVKVGDIGTIMDNFEETGRKLDERAQDLEIELKDIEEEVKKEKERLSGPQPNSSLRQRASIGVFAPVEGEVEIVLIYAVRQAAWAAGYDIRVDMQAKEKPVTVIYKAAISQSTGEDWTDVPLTLETAMPTFGLEIPTLSPWSLSVARQVSMKRRNTKSKSVALDFRKESASHASPSLSRGAMIVEHYEYEEEDGSVAMDHRGLSVSSKGNITATFQVPGTIDVPSDGASHNVTVTQLKLDATMSWVTVPKKDAKTHLKAKVKNASEYTLLQGPASVYVDGSFIAKSDVPLVSPGESFDCPLGLDPTIRITYHPRIKKVSQTGFYISKNSNHVFTQRITIHNTKNTTISNLKVIDQFPISEDSQITVKYVSPPLVLPNPTDTGMNRDGTVKAPSPVKAGDNVTAQWEGADESGFDLETLGRDGKLHWLCTVPSQGKVNLSLSWEVTAPLRTDIAGLTL